MLEPEKMLTMSEASFNACWKTVVLILTLHSVVDCISIFVSSYTADVFTANIAISWTKSVNFLSQMIQSNNNQFLLRISCTKLRLL